MFLCICNVKSFHGTVCCLLSTWKERLSSSFCEDIIILFQASFCEYCTRGCIYKITLWGISIPIKTCQILEKSPPLKLSYIKKSPPSSPFCKKNPPSSLFSQKIPFSGWFHVYFRLIVSLCMPYLELFGPLQGFQNPGPFCTRCKRKDVPK